MLDYCRTEHALRLTVHRYAEPTIAALACQVTGDGCVYSFYNSGQTNSIVVNLILHHISASSKRLLGGVCVGRGVFIIIGRRTGSTELVVNLIIHQRRLPRAKRLGVGVFIIVGRQISLYKDVGHCSKFDRRAGRRHIHFES